MSNQLFFDFDGTIANSEKGIILSIKYMIDQLKLPHLTDEQYRTFIGPAMTTSLNKYFPELSEDQVLRGVDYYQTSYAQDGIFELEVYPGIETALDQLKTAGYQLNIASAKPEDVLHRILNQFRLKDYFTGVYGATVDERIRSKKADILAYGIRQSHATPSQSVMIGDRYTDMNGGQENQVKTLGVTYGFGDAAELRAANATAIVTSPEELPVGITALMAE